jgi:DNA polymerase III delta prime subunit
MRFEGTSAYVATDDLKIAVNAAIALGRPLLVKGEPGTGKTVLALEIAKALGAPLIEWHIKSTTKALRGLYEYDAITRLRDSQLGDARVNDIRNYIKRGKLWEAFVSDERPVLLIDEIDKADIEFLTTSYRNSIAWNSSSTRPAKQSMRAAARSLSSPQTTRRNCRTRFCAAASSITSAFRMPRRWARSSKFIFRESRTAWSPKR